MPYSSNSGKQVIKTIVTRLDKLSFRGAPLRALDIGCGSGTYPNFINPLMSSKISWTGVEIWEPYVEQFKLAKLYDELLIQPAQEAVAELLGRLIAVADSPIERSKLSFDLIFVGDVLEHMTRDVASRVLDTCKLLLDTKGVLIVSVPIGEYPQGEYLGNPHEAHVDTWRTIDELQEELSKTPSEQPSYIAKCAHDSEIGVGFYMSGHVMSNIAPKLAAYMICKNEEAFIERCLTSLEGAEEVIVCDTGSTDKTVEIIESFNTINKDLWINVTLKKIHVSPWRFDDARNTALSFVPVDIDLCISIDADELLDDDFIAKVKIAWWDSLWTGKPFTRLNHSFMTHWNWDKPDAEPSISRHYHERVHARFGYRWIHPVHEKLVTYEPEVISWCTEALMKQLPDGSKSRSSYGPLLEQAVKEDPTDWKLWSFLANERSQAGNIDGALAALEECSKQPNADRVFIAMRRASLFEHQRSFDKAEDALLEAVRINPNLREIYVLLAELNARWARDGTSYLVKALKCKQETKGYMRRESVWTPEFELNAIQLIKDKA